MTLKRRRERRIGPHPPCSFDALDLNAVTDANLGQTVNKKGNRGAVLIQALGVLKTRHTPRSTITIIISPSQVHVCINSDSVIHLALK